MKRDTDSPGLVVAAVVVLVLAFLALGWLAGHNAIRKAKLTKVTAELRDIRTSLGSFHRDFGHYPTGTATDIIGALMGKNPTGRRFLVLSSSGPPYQDPWREAFILIPAAGIRGPEFYSKGPDRIDDKCGSSSDDVRSGPP